MSRIAAIALTLAPAAASAHEAALPHVHTDLGPMFDVSPAPAVVAGVAAFAALIVAMRRGAGR